ncbi:MAG: hypothetical protein LBJ10_09765 [Clostridiales bacterium]|nr:hypothetical protein [Clostridiales bacterium]
MAAGGKAAGKAAGTAAGKKKIFRIAPIALSGLLALCGCTNSLFKSSDPGRIAHMDLPQPSVPLMGYGNPEDTAAADAEMDQLEELLRLEELKKYESDLPKAFGLDPSCLEQISFDCVDYDEGRGAFAYAYQYTYPDSAYLQAKSAYDALPRAEQKETAPPSSSTMLTVFATRNYITGQQTELFREFANPASEGVSAFADRPPDMDGYMFYYNKAMRFYSAAGQPSLTVDCSAAYAQLVQLAGAYPEHSVVAADALNGGRRFTVMIVMMPALDPEAETQPEGQAGTISCEIVRISERPEGFGRMLHYDLESDTTTFAAKPRYRPGAAEFSVAENLAGGAAAPAAPGDSAAIAFFKKFFGAFGAGAAVFVSTEPGAGTSSRIAALEAKYVPGQPLPDFRAGVNVLRGTVTAMKKSYKVVRTPRQDYQNSIYASDSIHLAAFDEYFPDIEQMPPPPEPEPEPSPGPSPEPAPEPEPEAAAHGAEREAAASAAAVEPLEAAAHGAEREAAVPAVAVEPLAAAPPAAGPQLAVEAGDAGEAGAAPEPTPAPTPKPPPTPAPVPESPTVPDFDFAPTPDRGLVYYPRRGFQSVSDELHEYYFTLVPESVTQPSYVYRDELGREATIPNANAVPTTDKAGWHSADEEYSGWLRTVWDGVRPYEDVRVLDGYDIEIGEDSYVLDFQTALNSGVREKPLAGGYTMSQSGSAYSLKEPSAGTLAATVTAAGGDVFGAPAAGVAASAAVSYAILPSAESDSFSIRIGSLGVSGLLSVPYQFLHLADGLDAAGDSYTAKSVMALGSSDFLFSSPQNGVVRYRSAGGAPYAASRVSAAPAYRSWQLGDGSFIAVGFPEPPAGKDYKFYDTDLPLARVLAYTLG